MVEPEFSLVIEDFFADNLAVFADFRVIRDEGFTDDVEFSFDITPSILVTDPSFSPSVSTLPNQLIFFSADLNSPSPGTYTLKITGTSVSNPSITFAVERDFTTF